MNVRAPGRLGDCVDIYTNIRLSDGATAVLVGLTHPSYYPVNVGRRRYGNLTGREAELAMIRMGVEAAGRYSVERAEQKLGGRAEAPPYNFFLRDSG
jgi:hypothetical protein